MSQKKINKETMPGLDDGNVVLAKYDEPVVDCDGNSYKTILLGYSQIWMAENLKVTHYRDGTEIPNIIDETSWYANKQGKCCDYENDIRNTNVYGKLYNGYAVCSEKNICPEGWHIPTMDEWMKLISCVGSVGGKLKESGTLHWKDPNAGATNDSLYTARPGGCRSSCKSRAN